MVHFTKLNAISTQMRLCLSPINYQRECMRWGRKKSLHADQYKQKDHWVSIKKEGPDYKWWATIQSSTRFRNCLLRKCYSLTTKEGKDLRPISAWKKTETETEKGSSFTMSTVWVDNPSKVREAYLKISSDPTLPNQSRIMMACGIENVFVSPRRWWLWRGKMYSGTNGRNEHE